VCHPDDSYRQYIDYLNIDHVSSPQPNIGRAEMEVLQFVTEHHPVSVREVADHFASTKGQVRTTLLNVMERLRKKGYLIRRKEQGIFRYSPSVPKGELFRNLVRDFVGKALGGSVSPFVAYLADEAKMSDSDIAELRKIVRQLKKPD
jgi:predicted transcriptional regulator